ncbi:MULTISPECIES: D-alanyl-D-alanine carboxypeptidase/D-alanyl-D-alanine-endopeptidase [unclassified Cetobacterium]|uniref:D-alanyl-D-alanine carboxypeptidase/D-alanyl-D-alanine endopeptidase n=1 Tax=unclassified Cetobacterium TaxID=2630983 RepID=UPI0009DCCB94|nr:MULTISPECIES: D-alanyl-D-alanine carboxypeptidase/D-alanyl-D-alanine-endopeptidase [unclassified Cetobacterium]
MKRKFLYLALITAFLTACTNTNRKDSFVDQQLVLPENIEKTISIPVTNQESSEKSKALTRFVNSEVLEHGNVGFYAIELGSGKVVDSYREEAALVPASVLKVVTGATALEVLGADSVLETKVFYDGVISKEGILKGDIYIQGGGDPTLGSDGISIDREAFLKTWINEVKRIGIKSIDGNIIVLDDLFGYEGIPGKWLWEDMGTNYGQGTYGISVFDNLYTLYLKTEVSGKKPEVIRTKPEISGLIFDNQGLVTTGGKREISVRGVPLENKRRIFGAVPQNKNGLTIQSDIPDPGLFLGQYFSHHLKRENVEFKGKVTTARLTSQRPKNPKIIAVTKSPPISEIVKILLTRSDNHYTEHLFQLIQKTKGVDIEKFWKEKGMDVHSLILRDGSGLSRGNVISAKLLTQILAYSESGLENLLPVAGKDGTVAIFLKNTSLEGKVKVKSGSMSGIQSYAGYAEKNGKKYAFTIIVNHWNGERSILRKEMETLLNEIL